MSTKKVEPARVRELLVRAPARLAEIYEHTGYRVRLLVERKDGRELSAHDQSVIPAVVAGYEADEHRPAVTAADVDLIEGLEALLEEEKEKSQAQKTLRKTSAAKKPSREKQPPRAK